MKTFRCLFNITESSFSIADPYKNDIGQLEINLNEANGLSILRIIDHKDAIDGVPIHRGLRVTVDIIAESLDKAVEMARARVDGFMAMLTVVTNATVGEVLLKLGFETTEGATSTEYIQIEYLYNDLFKRKRAFDNNKLNNFGEKLLKVNDNRIFRTVRWYRKGLIEADPLDRFMSFWLGLENLNKKLAKLLGENTETRNCASCGLQYEVHTAKGIRSLFNKYSKNGLSDFNLCRKLRVDIQHGAGNLETAMSRADECSELCRLALLKGIYLVLDLDLKELEDGLVPIYNIQQPRIEFRGYYKIAPKDLPAVPLILINSQEIKVSVVDGKRTISLINQLDSNISADMTTQMTIITEHGLGTNNIDIKTVPKV